MNSYSLDKFQADSFTPYGRANKKGVLTVTKVPAARILATPGSGYGCLNEAEIVILGGNTKSVSVVTPSPSKIVIPAGDKMQYVKDYLRDS
jgi:hypothetical protein